MKKITVLFLFIMFVGVTVQATESGACDRACLEAIADQYINAMVAHDASKAPLAEDLVFTENTIKLPPTEGLWFTASGLGDFKFYVADLQTEQVAWTGVVKEHNKPVLLSVRLKVVDRRITEAGIRSEACGCGAACCPEAGSFPRSSPGYARGG